MYRTALAKKEDLIFTFAPSDIRSYIIDLSKPINLVKNVF